MIKQYQKLWKTAAVFCAINIYQFIYMYILCIYIYISHTSSNIWRIYRCLQTSVTKDWARIVTNTSFYYAHDANIERVWPILTRFGKIQFGWWSQITISKFFLIVKCHRHRWNVIEQILNCSFQLLEWEIYNI